MIKSFTITNDLGESLYLDIRKPEDSGFLITSVSGLTPSKAEVSSSSIAMFDGAEISSIRAEERNIVFSIIYDQNNKAGESIEDLRWKSYRYFPLKKTIAIEIENDKGVFKTSGVVESNEIAIFSQLEGSQVSIICPDPYFWSEGSDTLNLYNEIPAFQFPVEFAETVEFSILKTYPDAELYYLGAGDCGLTIDMEVLGNVHDMKFFDLITKDSFTLDSTLLTRMTGSDLKNGDHITINTRRKKKSAILVRNGVTYNILSCIRVTGDWITLHAGRNRFGYTADVGYSRLRISLIYETNYVGV